MQNGIAIFRRGRRINAGEVGRNRDSEPIFGYRLPVLTLQQARCCKHGRRWTTATVSQAMTHRW